MLVSFDIKFIRQDQKHIGRASPTCFWLSLINPISKDTIRLPHKHVRLALISGPNCSKLTTSLVNDPLKLQMLISQICQYFLLKKCEKLLHCIAKASLIFSTKNISVIGYKVVKHLMS